MTKDFVQAHLVSLDDANPSSCYHSSNFCFLCLFFVQHSDWVPDICTVHNRSSFAACQQGKTALFAVLVDGNMQVGDGWQPASADKFMWVISGKKAVGKW